MPEWSNGAVSKTVVPLAGTGGSNPFLSASKIIPFPRYVGEGDFVYMVALKIYFHKRTYMQNPLLHLGAIKGIILLEGLPPQGCGASATNPWGGMSISA